MPMTRRRLLGAASALALAPVAIRAEDPGPKRITWALYLPSEEGRKRWGEPRDRIRGLLKSRGLVEGRDFTITFVELPKGDGKRESDEFADRLVRSDAQIIVMFAHTTLWSLRTRTRSIPVVFYELGSDPSKMGLVESLRRPGTNFTGAFLGMNEWTLRNLQHLKELVPSMTRVGILVSKETWELSLKLSADIREMREELMRAAKAQLGIELLDVVVPGSASAVEVEAALRESRVHAVMPVGFGGWAATSKLPTSGFGFASAKGGMLMAVGRNPYEGESYAIEAVHQIVRGQDVATIPVYQNRSLAIAINRTTARRLGIEIPQSMVLRAEEIYD